MTVFNVSMNLALEVLRTDVCWFDLVSNNHYEELPLTQYSPPSDANCTISRFLKLKAV